MLSAEVKRMFAEVDVDGSGAIDASELRELLQNLGVYLTARELELAVLSIDKDGSVSSDSQMPLLKPHRSIQCVGSQAEIWCAGRD
eukprot:COSAG02_NODE_31529_length_532_cov_0.535797_1_plen_86_part_00